MLRGYNALIFEALNNGLHARHGGVGHPVGNEVDPCQQGTAVNPLCAGLPSLHAGGSRSDWPM